MALPWLLPGPAPGRMAPPALAGVGRGGVARVRSQQKEDGRLGKAGLGIAESKQT
ncbi:MULTISPECIES: hypothetical protein [unclassified Azospirillum]|uniref:hypothetical protein n=1 Tax=unclassified Azospirillum TaxID=2630922 RepID=UPI001357383D|nr:MULTISPECIES: hypothetical protein [unclassified Azospirillum]